MAAGLKTKRLLDPKECWKMWNEHGSSLTKVQKRLFDSGRFNEKTGKPPTTTGIEKAAFQWALDNLDEARKDLEHAWMREGEILDDKAWDSFIVAAAKNIFNQRPGKLERFLREHGLEGYT